jgi:hypothetical protein
MAVVTVPPSNLISLTPKIEPTTPSASTTVINPHLLFFVFILLVLMSNFWAYTGIEFVKDFFNHGSPLTLREWFVAAMSFTIALLAVTYLFGIPFAKVSTP